MKSRRLAMGIDGGGTKSLGLLTDEQGNVLSTYEVGATNPNVVGIEASAANLIDLIIHCCEEIRCAPDELGAVILGLAGASAPATRGELEDRVEALFESRGIKSPALTIETDARVSLEGAFNGASGVVIIAGTGSIIIAKTENGEIIRAGGWGRKLGDEGSGYDVGLQAIRCLLSFFDGRGDAGKLRETFSIRYGWNSRETVLNAIYQDGFEIASLAPVVMATAADNDIVSQRIIQAAAAHLVEQARVIVMRLGMVKRVALVMGGGLLDHETVYRNVLHMKIMKSLPQVDIRPPRHSAAYGAALMALSRLKNR